MAQVNGGSEPRRERLRSGSAGYDSRQRTPSAALTAASRVGLGDADLLQLAAAAASLNVTRHGLASGNLAAINRMVPLVKVEAIPTR